jgi:hypothetical protein
VLLHGTLWRLVLASMDGKAEAPCVCCVQDKTRRTRMDDSHARVCTRHRHDFVAPRAQASSQLHRHLHLILVVRMGVGIYSRFSCHVSAVPRCCRAVSWSTFPLSFATRSPPPTTTKKNVVSLLPPMHIQNSQSYCTAALPSSLRRICALKAKTRSIIGRSCGERNTPAYIEVH